MQEPASKLQVPAKEFEDEATCEIEKQTETERQTELQTEEQTEKEKVRLHEIDAISADIKKYESFLEAIKTVQKGASRYEKSGVAIHDFRNYPTFALNSYLETEPELKPYASAFEGIDCALNVLEWTDKGDDFTLLGSHRTDIHHLLVRGDTVTILTQNEAEYFRNNADYYNLTLGFIDPKKKPTTEQLYKIAKIKFLNGESQFTQEEQDLLKVWIRQMGHEMMQKLYVGDILKGSPHKAQAYQTSPLQQLLAAGA